MTISDIYEPSSSTSDSDSIFSPSATSLSSSIASTPRPLDDDPTALSSSARQRLLERLLAQMDPAAVKQVEDAARAVRQQQFDHPPTVRCLERARVSTEHGQAFLYRYVSSADPGKEHLAWVYRGAPLAQSLAARLAGESEDQHKVRGYYSGTLLDPAQSSNRHAHDGIDTSDGGAALVRIHSECFTGDIMGSTRCDCGEQLKEAKRIISQRGGVILYLRQEGRGIGLGEKMKAYNLQDLGVDTVMANQLLGHASDARTFGLATAILADLGLSEIRLLTNNPDKIESVEGAKRVIKVTERVAMIPLAWQNKPDGIYSKELDRYLHTKRTRMGHLLD
ncbi:hypothetical protein D0Z03_001355 [Geotrichum reessii]|nr:hypothetical protein D0Z03_001355 [Galactomyces reessii]